MARITLTLPLLLSVVWATVPDSVTYVGPDTVVQLSQGSGQYQIGIKDGDTLQGPCRLVATDTRLYLLDQFNNRVLCYDTAGTFVFEAKTCFQPVDMAVDDSNRVHLLENGKLSSTVIVMDGQNLVERMEIRHAPGHKIRRMVIYPELGLLFRTNYRFNKPKRTFDFAGILACSPLVTTYRLEKEEAISSEDGWCVDGSGTGGSFTLVAWEITRKANDCLAFLDDDSSSRVFIGIDVLLEDYKGENHQETRMNNLKVVVGNKHNLFIKGLPGSYYCTVHWRNVAIDCRGNVYVFDLDQDGKACILKWRPSLP